VPPLPRPVGAHVSERVNAGTLTHRCRWLWNRLRASCCWCCTDWRCQSPQPTRHSNWTHHHYHHHIISFLVNQLPTAGNGNYWKALEHGCFSVERIEPLRLLAGNNNPSPNPKPSPNPNPKPSPNSSPYGAVVPELSIITVTLAFGSCR